MASEEHPVGSMLSLRNSLVSSQRQSDEEHLPLASAPEDMLRLCNLHTGGKSPSIQTLVESHATLQLDTADKAFQLLAERNPILRSSLGWIKDAAYQSVHEHVVVPVFFQDVRGLSPHERNQHLAEVMARGDEVGFTGNEVTPLRVTIRTIHDRHHQLLISFNYLFIDGWSLRLLLQEWSLIYKALDSNIVIPLHKRPRYSDYLRWLINQDLRQGRDFWRRELRDVTPTPIVKAAGRTLPLDSGSSQTSVTLDSTLTKQLRLLARKLDCTESVVFQCGWGLLLAEMTGCRDVMFGVAFTGRSVQVSSIDEIAGFMVNFLPVRMQLSEMEITADLLRKTQAKQQELHSFESVNLSKLRYWSGLGSSDYLFESVLYFQNLGGLLNESVGMFRYNVPYPIRLDIFPGDGTIGTSLHISFRKERFRNDQASNMLNELEAILSRITQLV